MQVNNSSRRITELSQYAIAASSLLLYPLHFLLLFAFLIGGKLEGIRITQIPNLLGFIINLFLNLLGFTPYTSQCSLCIGLSLSLILRLVYGNTDFSKYPSTPEAPFKCGYSKVSTFRFRNEVHVYYPIDKNTEITKEKDANWLAHGDKTIKGLLMLVLGKRYSEKEMGPQVLLRDLKGIKIGVS
jgi:hypothetical protein